MVRFVVGVCRVVIGPGYGLADPLPYPGDAWTIVDLILDGTLSVPMAAYALRAMERGASLLTAARPGGAGKTTLLASILHLLPPGVRIVTVDGPDVARYLSLIGPFASHCLVAPRRHA